MFRFYLHYKKKIHQIKLHLHSVQVAKWFFFTHKQLNINGKQDKNKFQIYTIQNNNNQRLGYKIWKSMTKTNIQ